LKITKKIIGKFSSIFQIIHYYVARVAIQVLQVIDSWYYWAGRKWASALYLLYCSIFTHMDYPALLYSNIQ